MRNSYKKNREHFFHYFSDVKFSNVAFTSIRNLYKNAMKIIPQITINDVKEFLKKQDSYTLHKLTPKRFRFYRKVIAPRPKIYLGLDLIDMLKYSEYNDGIKYLIFLIDIFSRKIWVYPVKSKTKSDILKTLEHFPNLRNDNTYIRIYSDLEGGLYSNLVLDLKNIYDSIF